MTWHIGAARLDSYLRQQLDDVSAASIEAHLMSCDGCRVALAELTPVQMIETSWDAVARSIDAEPARAIDRLLVRSGVPDREVRLLGPTLPLRLAWFGAAAAALLCAAFLVPDTPRGLSIGTLGFLVLATVVPVAVVAATLGTATEPAPEIAAVTPMSRWDLTMRRVVAALAASVLAGLVAGLVLPGPWTRGSLWLCPSLALCASAVALSGRFDPTRAALGVTAVWTLGVVLWSSLASDRLAPFGGGAQLAYLLAAVLLVGVLVLRPDLVDHDRRPSWSLTNRGPG